jgi:tRNA(Ser,Leu) C12 N-acetylase TAN1
MLAYVLISCMQAIKRGFIMIDIEINIKFYKEVAFGKKVDEILKDIDGIHIKYFAETESKEHIVIFGYQCEDDQKAIESFIDKLSKIEGKKTFSMDCREIKINPLDGFIDIIIPYIPQLLNKLNIFNINA